MAKKTRKKGEEKGDLDLLENPDALAEKLSKGEEYVRKNSNRLTYIAIVVLALIGGGYWYISTNGLNVAGMMYVNPETEKEAQVDMFQAQYYFEQDSFQIALEGGGQLGAVGFEDIMNDYSNTRAGNLAKFYAGVCNLRMGNKDEALELLESFNTSDKLMEPRKLALIGDIYMEDGDLDKAISYYTKASNLNPNLYFTPNYLMKLALAYEKNGNNAEAVKAYGRIIKEFPTCSELNDAKKYKTLAESK